MTIFAMNADDDVVYAEADDEDQAFEMLCKTFGAMPREIVSIKEY